MKDKQKIIIITGIVVLFLILCALFIYQRKNKDNNTASEILESTQIDEKIEEVDWDSLTKKDVNLTDSYKITNDGAYHLTGEISDGAITIEVTGNVKLILDNVKITNKNGPAINIISAKNVMIYLSDNSTNTLVDGNSYAEDSSIDGAIFSKADLFFDGTGTLNLTANYLDGIVSNDDLVILNGNYVINAKDDAIRGKDSVKILNGNFSIKALGDGIKATNTLSDKGYIVINNGTFNIDANLDGIEAESKLMIYDGNYTITTGGGNVNNNSYLNRYNESDDSKKGIKAQKNIVIKSGKFVFNTYDDSIHSNQDIGIINGDIKISSGDDGIHATNILIIDNGTITVEKSYEGLEASKITINNGDISLNASDDGINIAGGVDSSSRENEFSSNSENVLTINGGNISVNSVGDGLDSNGNIYMYGGNVLIYGPTNDGNGTLDYNGSFILDGGYLLATGSSGMFQGISSSSKQNNVTIYFDENVSANTSISVQDSNQEEIISFTSSKSFSSMVMASDKLKSNETYTILINGSTYKTFKMTSTQVTVGNAKGKMNNRPMGRR